jgi:hypothetical protein
MSMTFAEYKKQIETFKASMQECEDQAEGFRKSKNYRKSGQCMKQYWAIHAEMCKFIKAHPDQDRAYTQEQMDIAVARINSNRSFDYIFNPANEVK